MNQTNIITTEATSEDILAVIKLIEDATVPQQVEIGTLITAMFAYIALLQKPEMEPDALITVVDEISKYMVFLLDAPAQIPTDAEGKLLMN